MARVSARKLFGANTVSFADEKEEAAPAASFSGGCRGRAVGYVKSNPRVGEND